jgi:Golgi apparatus protein 1
MRHATRKPLAAGLAALALALGCAGAGAAEDIVASAQEACKAELDSYCKSVSPGGGRILHCLAAHEDKLSGRCEFGLYKAANQLDQFLTAFQHVASQCADDLKTHCGEVPVGEGEWEIGWGPANRARAGYGRR